MYLTLNKLLTYLLTYSYLFSENVALPLATFDLQYSYTLRATLVVSHPIIVLAMSAQCGIKHAVHF